MITSMIALLVIAGSFGFLYARARSERDEWKQRALEYESRLVACDMRWGMKEVDAAWHRTGESKSYRRMP